MPMSFAAASGVSLIGGCVNGVTPSGAGTVFAHPFQTTDGGAGTLPTVETGQVRMYFAKAGTLSNLRVWVGAVATGGAGETCVTTVRVNGADSTLSTTHTLDAELSTLKEDNDSVSVAAGDYLTIEFTTSAAMNPVISWVFEYRI